MNRVRHDVAPVIAAQALVAHGMNDIAVIAYVRRTWRLDADDAWAAAHTLAGDEHGIRVATRADQ